MDTTLKEQIDRIASRTPRFLFRVRHSASGGQRGLNTPEAIVPLAFTKSNKPSALHTIDRTDMTTLMNQHMIGAHIDTPFSSWTQSLPHISIVDTKRLSADAKFLWSPSLQTISPAIYKNWDIEYLAFGVVSGEAHAAVPWKKLYESGILELVSSNPSASEYPWRHHANHQLPHCSLLLPDTDRALKIALQVASLYGEGFKVAAAAYLLSFRERAPIALTTIREALSVLFIPSEWSTDVTITTSSVVETAGFRDADRAIALLRSLANGSRTRSTADRARVTEELQQHIQHIEATQEPDGRLEYTLAKKTGK